MHSRQHFGEPSLEDDQVAEGEGSVVQLAAGGALGDNLLDQLGDPRLGGVLHRADRRLHCVGQHGDPRLAALGPGSRVAEERRVRRVRSFLGGALPGLRQEVADGVVAVVLGDERGHHLRQLLPSSQLDPLGDVLADDGRRDLRVHLVVGVVAALVLDEVARLGELAHVVVVDPGPTEERVGADRPGARFRQRRHLHRVGVGAGRLHSQPAQEGPVQVGPSDEGLGGGEAGEPLEDGDEADRQDGAQHGAGQRRPQRGQEREVGAAQLEGREGQGVGRGDDGDEDPGLGEPAERPHREGRGAAARKRGQEGVDRGERLLRGGEGGEDARRGERQAPVPQNRQRDGDEGDGSGRGRELQARHQERGQEVEREDAGHGQDRAERPVQVPAMEEDHHAEAAQQQRVEKDSAEESSKVGSVHVAALGPERGPVRTQLAKLVVAHLLVRPHDRLALKDAGGDHGNCARRGLPVPLGSGQVQRQAGRQEAGQNVAQELAPGARGRPGQRPLVELAFRQDGVAGRQRRPSVPRDPDRVGFHLRRRGPGHDAAGEVGPDRRRRLVVEPVPLAGVRRKLHLLLAGVDPGVVENRRHAGGAAGGCRRAQPVEEGRQSRQRRVLGVGAVDERGDRRVPGFPALPSQVDGVSGHVEGDLGQHVPLGHRVRPPASDGDPGLRRKERRDSDAQHQHHQPACAVVEDRVGPQPLRRAAEDAPRPPSFAHCRRPRLAGRPPPRRPG